MGPSERKLLAKSVPVAKYLASLGFVPESTTSSYSYYYSPIPGRKESHPSFLVRCRDGKWNDRGTNSEWDDVIALAMKVEECSFNEALDKLTGFEGTEAPPKERQGHKSSLVIDEVVYGFSFPLEYELKHRKVDVYTAKEYCKQAYFRFPNSRTKPYKRHMALAFKNDLGGYELRNSYIKVSNSPKYYTYIPGEGPDRDFFEGFMDFLSHLTYNRMKKHKNHTYVLNSLIYLPLLFDAMKEEGQNNLYLDNDSAADLHMQELEAEGIAYNDMRHIYMIYNDYNDMLINNVKLF